MRLFRFHRCPVFSCRFSRLWCPRSFLLQALQPEFYRWLMTFFQGLTRVCGFTLEICRWRLIFRVCMLVAMVAFMAASSFRCWSHASSRALHLQHACGSFSPRKMPAQHYAFEEAHMVFQCLSDILFYFLLTFDMPEDKMSLAVAFDRKASELAFQRWLSTAIWSLLPALFIIFATPE